MAGIELKNIIFKYPGSPLPVINDLSLNVSEGSFMTLIGPSGCGKSTLLRLIAGLEKPQSGSIRCGDKEVSAPCTDIGMVFQSPALFPWLTVRENVAFAARKADRSLSKADSRGLAEEVLKRVGLQNALGLFPSQLSGGMAQRTSLARALAINSPILLLDEPFSAIDPKNRMALQELILELWENDRKTVLFVTHDIDEAILLGDTITFMEPGKIFTRHQVGFSRPRKRETLLVSAQCCTLRKKLISLFYQWGEAVEINP